MFDISIGTLIPALSAKALIPQLNQKGFESYELNIDEIDPRTFDFDAFADEILPLLDGRTVSACGFYRNPIKNRDEKEMLIALIRNLSKLNCNVIGAFAGGLPDKSIPETISAYAETWKEIGDVAGECGVKIGFEGCGNGWNGGSHNIAYCSDAWDLMFDALDHPALGLEWEPCHALEILADPIAQLRQYASRVVHIHGKDGTVAWDVISRYGVNAGRQYMWNRTPGFGDTNWADIFTILLQTGFVGACDIEGYHDPVHYDDMEWTAQATAVEYLKRCRGGVEYFAGPSEYRGYQGARKK